MKNRNTPKGSNNDEIIKHFIFVGFFLIDIFLKLINLIISEKKDSNHQDRINGEEELKKRIVNSKSEEELRAGLDGIDLASTMNKEELISIYSRNPKALKKLQLDERRNILMKLKNDELRAKLKGKMNLAKLKKVDLVELIINEEN